MRAPEETLAQLDGIETWTAREDVPDLVALVRHLLAERDAYKRAKAENDQRFMLERDEARDKYASALTVLNALECAADGGLTVHACGVITPADVKAVESWQRIVDDLKDFVETEDEP